ncbi:MAG: NAD(P)-dependent oxidoreductase [Fimbriimonadaceae bacterium]
MSSAIVVHPDFEAHWSLAADHAAALWRKEGPVEFVRLEPTDRRPVGEALKNPGSVTRLLSMGVPLTEACLAALPVLRVAAVFDTYGELDWLEARGVRRIKHLSEGFWGQSVAECGLALTLCALRRIPQLHHTIIKVQTPWDYNPPGGVGQPGSRAHQYCDDPRFTAGTIEGKRVRIVGAGNIGSRYASFVKMLGADVAAWDPFASEPCFHRAGSVREFHLDRLVKDAEIFAPMLPLTSETEGLVTADHIDALPNGCLVVLATRANICDMARLRRRVLADELSLAADVFDVEPLPLNDPLLGRHNVVHTPHIAGRTRQANEQWAEMLLAQFSPL